MSIFIGYLKIRSSKVQSVYKLNGIQNGTSVLSNWIITALLLRCSPTIAQKFCPQCSPNQKFTFCAISWCPLIRPFARRPPGHAISEWGEWNWNCRLCGLHFKQTMATCGPFNVPVDQPTDWWPDAWRCRCPLHLIHLCESCVMRWGQTCVEQDCWWCVGKLGFSLWHIPAHH